MPFAAICNYSLLKKDNNKFLKDLPPHSLICLSLMSILKKILFSFSVKKKLLKTLKNFTLWKLEIQLQVNQNSKNQPISKFSKKEIFQFLSKIVKNTE
jgi:hypothetical protein